MMLKARAVRPVLYRRSLPFRTRCTIIRRRLSSHPTQELIPNLPVIGSYLAFWPVGDPLAQTYRFEDQNASNPGEGPYGICLCRYGNKQ